MTVVYKTVSASGGDGLEFVLSDSTVDSYGDIVEASGFTLQRFVRNPIALFGHNSGFPIGTWENVRVKGGQLIGRLKLAARGTSVRLDEIISLVEQGILKAVSVGFAPIEWEPIDPKKPYAGQRYKKMELHEASIVSVPANPSAVALAKSLKLSAETMSMAFGEHAITRRMGSDAHGENANHPTRNKGNRAMSLTLAQRIVALQDEIVAKKDKLAELSGADDFDADAVEELNGQIERSERELAIRKAAEAKIGIEARAASSPTVPAQPRKPLGHQEKDGMDLLVRAAVVRNIAHVTRQSIDEVIEQRYPGYEAVGIIAKADQTIGSTTGSHWADDLVQTAYFGFLEALIGYSIFPVLVNGGLSLTFDRWGTLSLPRRTAGGAGGGFVAEGSPIRVGKITTAAATLTPKKMGVIVAFTRELAKRSTPAIEGIVRQSILEDTGAILDPIILDATASSTSRPAGLLNGVSSVGTGYAGGDYMAVRQDFRALLAPFYSADGTDNILVIMNPAQGLNMAMMEGPQGDPDWLMRIKERVTIVESTRATANRLIAVRVSDFAAAGGNPEFDVSEQATIHMEDTTPLEIVSGTGPTTADPVRSLWQTASVGVRMLMDVSWTMRRTGMVQWVDTTSW